MPNNPSSYKKIFGNEIKHIQEKLPEFSQRLLWSREHILAAQQEGIRNLISYAKQHSEWHRKRLSSVDEKKFTLDQLKLIPTMTKTDVMENWDTLITDKNLTLAKANAFLNHLKPEHPQFFLDKLHIYATGGSSGQRGVFAWNQEDFITSVMAFFRYQYRDEFSHWNSKNPLVVAVITADHPVHMSTPVFSVPILPSMQMHLIYATLPLQEMIDKLNHIQPTHLIGYTSVIHRLAEQAFRRGNLKIKPRRISVNSEPLFPESRKLLEDTWDVPITNMWSSTECGPHAVSCDKTPCLHLTEDLLIFESIDKNKKPVPPGRESYGVLVTNLINKTIPLIRYEMDDRITILDGKCSCGAHYKLVDEVKGRMDNDFVYPGNIVVSTEIFESPLFSSPAVMEYQVLQKINGADVFVVTNNKTLDSVHIQNTIRAAYKKLGIFNPQINMSIVDQLEKHVITGKLKRYVPLKKATIKV